MTGPLPFLLLLPLYALAAARLTRLVTTDRIFEEPRKHLANWLADHRHPLLLYLLTCRWCASMWVSVPVVVIAYYAGDNPLVLIVGAALAVSYGIGWAADHEGA